MADALTSLARLAAPIAPALAALLLAWAAPASADPNDPDLQTYARRCFARLAVDPADLAGPFDCLDGKRLPTRVHGQIQDSDVCTGAGCATDFPASCDFPAWLRGGGQCYGHSYITTFRPQSNDKVRVALLCRHKTEWTADPQNFDDIAMIVHNQGNGETCWFQTETDAISVALDGERVPGPATAGAESFWLRPTETADIDCFRCHDSSPFMVSPWLRKSVGTALNDRPDHPYRYSEKPFDRWPVPRFVKVEKRGLAEGDRSCTSCHKIAVGGTRGGQTMQTCAEWIDWTTTAGTIPSQNETRDSRNVFMPLVANEGLLDHAAFASRYDAHVKHLKKCCERAEGVASGKVPGVADCEVFTPPVGAATP